MYVHITIRLGTQFDLSLGATPLQKQVYKNEYAYI